MININGKDWDKLRMSDIKKLLSQSDDETFFFEYKDDDVSPKKLIEEISAFANTYGGYIFLGVKDDKSILGCKKWNEQRIHTVIHDSITPIPIFDVKKFKESTTGNIIFVIKINEGLEPPYITNTGKIYERVSSGSFPIKDSTKLTQIYYKREDNLKRIKNKIEMDKMLIDTLPNNLCGYVDLGFSINVSDLKKFKKRFLDFDYQKISTYLKENNVKDFSITMVGYSLVISLGKMECKQGDKVLLSPSGINNFIEIMNDGSVKIRVMLTADENGVSNISPLTVIDGYFKQIYKMIVGENFYKEFIYAQHYKKLVVLKQFYPTLSAGDKYDEYFNNYISEHESKYGKTLIITDSRLPKNDYLCIDKKYFEHLKLKYNNDNLLNELFRCIYLVAGFIDDFPVLEKD